MGWSVGFNVGGGLGKGWRPFWDKGGLVVGKTGSHYGQVLGWFGSRFALEKVGVYVGI